jgi:hypothetical protein
MVNVRPQRGLSSGFHTLRSVILFAPSAAAVQIFISTMTAFGSQDLGFAL